VRTSCRRRSRLDRERRRTGHAPRARRQWTGPRSRSRQWQRPRHGRPKRLAFWRYLNIHPDRAASFAFRIHGRPPRWSACNVPGSNMFEPFRTVCLREKPLGRPASLFGVGVPELPFRWCLTQVSTSCDRYAGPRRMCVSDLEMPSIILMPLTSRLNAGMSATSISARSQRPFVV
jgi:hypothetical protein